MLDVYNSREAGKFYDFCLLFSVLFRMQIKLILLSLTWVSRGKLSNLMGQMKLMWVAWEYMISLSLVIHRPACFDNTSTTCTQVESREVLWKYSKIIHDCIFSQFPATTVFPCDPVQKWSNKPIGISCIYEREIFYSDQKIIFLR